MRVQLLQVIFPIEWRGQLFKIGANFLYHLCALILFKSWPLFCMCAKQTQKELAKHVQKFFVQNFLLSLSFRLGRILKPIWAVTRQATCNCKPQCPPTSADFLQGSSLYISTTIMWGRGGATFQNPHFLFRRRDHVQTFLLTDPDHTFLLGRQNMYVKNGTNFRNTAVGFFMSLACSIY